MQLTHRNFRATVAAHDFVIVDFWAQWCAPCLAFKPIFESAADRHPDVLFGSVDTMQEPDLVHLYDIRAIPTLVLFRDGIEIDRVAAPMTVTRLDEVIHRTGALDMDELRASMIEGRG